MFLADPNMVETCSHKSKDRCFHVMAHTKCMSKMSDGKGADFPHTLHTRNTYLNYHFLRKIHLGTPNVVAGNSTAYHLD